MCKQCKMRLWREVADSGEFREKVGVLIMFMGEYRHTIDAK